MKYGMEEGRDRHGHGHHHHHGKHEFGRHGWGQGRGYGKRGRHAHWAEDGDDSHEGRRRFFDSADLRLILLKLIADQPRHGYDLIRAIEELTGGVYVPSPGVVYPALSILADMNHIESKEPASGRNTFAITKDGQAELEANAEKVKALFARLAEFGEARQRSDASPVRRAMENLKTVLRARFGQAEMGKTTQHDIAAILDEAAQRIERL